MANIPYHTHTFDIPTASYDEATDGTSDSVVMTPLRTAQVIGPLVEGAIGGAINDVIDVRAATIALDIPFVDSYLQDTPEATDLQRINAAIADYNAGNTGGFKFKARDYIVDGPTTVITRSRGVAYGVKGRTRLVTPAGTPYFAGIGGFLVVATAGATVADFVIRDITFALEHNLVDGLGAKQVDVWAVWLRRTSRCAVVDCTAEGLSGLVRLGGDTADEKTRLFTVSGWRGDFDKGLNCKGNIWFQNGSSGFILHNHLPCAGTKSGNDTLTNMSAATILINPALGQIIDTLTIFDNRMQAFGKPHGLLMNRCNAPITNLRVRDNNFDHTSNIAIWWDASTDNGQPDPDDPDDPGARIYSRLTMIANNRTSTDSGRGIVMDTRGGRVHTGIEISGNVVQIKDDSPAFELITNAGQIIDCGVYYNKWNESGPVAKTVAAKISGRGVQYVGNSVNRATEIGESRYAAHLQITDAATNDLIVIGNQQAPTVGGGEMVAVIEPVYTALPGNRIIQSSQTVSSRRLGIGSARGDGTNEAVALDADEASWIADSSTPQYQPSPAAGNRPRRFNAGLYLRAAPKTFSTCGSMNVICGEGPSSRLRNQAIIVKDNACTIKDIMLDGPATYGQAHATALSFKGSLRRKFNGQSIWIADRDVGLSHEDTSAADTISGLFISGCRDGLRSFYDMGCGDNLQVSDAEIIECSEFAANLINAQGYRFTQVRGRRLHLAGDRRANCLENYFVANTWTDGDSRFIPIYAVTDNGAGKAKFRLINKITVDVTQHAAIMINGRKGMAARGEFTLTGGTTGQVTQVSVGGVNLLSAPVVFATTLTALATAVAAAINAGTSTGLNHGYRARADGGLVSLFAPVLDAETANGRVVAITVGGVGGDLTYSQPSFIAMTYTGGNHGLSLEDRPYFRRLSGGTVGNNKGHFQVKAIDSPTVIVTECPYSANASGEAWMPHIISRKQPEIDISNAPGFNGRLAQLLSADEEGITLDAAYSAYSAMPVGVGNARIEVPGTNVIIGTLERSNTACADQWFIGGNANTVHIYGALNINFWGTRLKRVVYVAEMLNPNMASDEININVNGRGRPSETFGTVDVIGADTGWSVTRAGKTVNDNLPGAGYRCIQSPARGAAYREYLVPSTNEWRVYETGIVALVGDQERLKIENSYPKPTLPAALGGSPTGAETQAMCNAIRSYLIATSQAT